MPTVECLIERVGPTEVKLDKATYMFHPIPDPNKRDDEPSTSIANISEGKHLDHLLRSKQFRLYVPGQTKKAKPVDMSGYAIVPHRDGRIEGYRVETATKPKQVAGSDGQWKDSIQGITPFDTEMQAFMWLKDEIKYRETEAKLDAKAKEDEEAAGVSTKEHEDLKEQLKALGVNPHWKWGIEKLREELARAQEKAKK